jgi:hypothetical protein
VIGGFAMTREVTARRLTEDLDGLFAEYSAARAEAEALAREKGISPSWFAVRPCIASSPVKSTKDRSAQPGLPYVRSRWLITDEARSGLPGMTPESGILGGSSSNLHSRRYPRLGVRQQDGDGLETDRPAIRP